MDETNRIPKHVAVIMDGNRRWAKARNLPVVMGHKKVVEERIEELIDHAGQLGVEYITFWAFSTENWERSEDEVGGIMNLFRWALEKKAKSLIEKGARLNWIGDLSKFSDDIREGFEKMAKASKIARERDSKLDKKNITVTFALNYGGRDEILRAVNRLVKEFPISPKGIPSGQLSQFPIIDEKLFSSHLDTKDLSDPDLIIRTSGEQRLSGFMPWQSVYSEFYFTDTLMPDFGKEEFDKAMEEYGKRQRRRGR